MVSFPRLTVLALCFAALTGVRTVLADGPPACTPADGSTHSCYGQRCDPPAYYSPWRYWAPALARVYDNHWGPKLSVYAPDRHPEVPLSFNALPFRCPPADPEATVLVPPTPPATSVVH
jgi:hypothetical protein